MALALPVLLETLGLHGFNVPIHTILPPHCGPEQVQAALARRQLLPLGARRIQEQSKPLRINITERHRPYFGAPLGRHGGEKTHVHMGIVVLSGLLTRVDDLCDRVHGYSPSYFSPRYDLRTTSLRSSADAVSCKTI